LRLFLPILTPHDARRAFPEIHRGQKDKCLFLELGNSLLDSLDLLLLGQLAALVLERLLLPLLLGLLLTSLVDLLERVLTDLLVGLGIQLLQSISFYLIIDIALELRLVPLLIVVGKGLHVLSNVATEDVFAESVGIELFGLDIETWETVLGVGDENATIGSTLHGTEDTGTSGCAVKTNIKESLEWSSILLRSLGKFVLSISLLNTSEILIYAKLLENTTGDQETSAVCGSPVGKTVLDAISFEFVGVGSGEDLVTSDLGGYDLHNDVAVGEADDETVLGRIVLVLGLGDEALASIVIGLSDTTALVLGLVAAVEVRIARS
jgi:hypothetical protein